MVRIPSDLYHTIIDLISIKDIFNFIMVNIYTNEITKKKFYWRCLLKREGFGGEINGLDLNELTIKYKQHINWTYKGCTQRFNVDFGCSKKHIGGINHQLCGDFLIHIHCPYIYIYCLVSCKPIRRVTIRDGIKEIELDIDTQKYLIITKKGQTLLYDIRTNKNQYLGKILKHKKWKFVDIKNNKILIKLDNNLHGLYDIHHKKFVGRVEGDYLIPIVYSNYISSFYVSDMSVYWVGLSFIDFKKVAPIKLGSYGDGVIDGEILNAQNSDTEIFFLRNRHLCSVNISDRNNIKPVTIHNLPINDFDIDDTWVIDNRVINYGKNWLACKSKNKKDEYGINIYDLRSKKHNFISNIVGRQSEMNHKYIIFDTGCKVVCLDFSFNISI